MKRTIALSVALALLSSSAFAATAAGTAGIAPLLQRLYADDAQFHPHVDPLWWSYLAARPKAILKHVNRVQRATGDALIDADALCWCNDSGGMKAKSITVTPKSPMRAVATVRIAGSNGAIYETVRIDMVNEGGWKIAEITNHKGDAYTVGMEQALKQYPGK